MRCSCSDSGNVSFPPPVVELRSDHQSHPRATFTEKHRTSEGSERTGHHLIANSLDRQSTPYYKVPRLSPSDSGGSGAAGPHWASTRRRIPGPPDPTSDAGPTEVPPYRVRMASIAAVTEPQDSWSCLLYTSPSPRDRTRSRMPS